MDPVTRSILEMTETRLQRNLRYQLNWAYYRAEQYLGDLGQQYAKEKKLFKAMRQVFGCVTQTVDTDARFIMRHELSVEADDRLQQSILDVWERSNFQTEKYKLARYGSNLGDAYLIVQNVGAGGAVVPRIIVANSEDMHTEKDPDDQNQVLWARQSYGYVQNGRHHDRDWVYWPDRIERYTDHKLDEGYPVPHPFSEVPVVHIKLIDVGEAYGLNSWHNVQPQVDEVNELGSYMNRILLRYADPTLVGKGMGPKDKPVFRKGINEDNVYFLTNPEADLSILEYQGDVLAHVISQIQEIASNIQDQIPELSLTKIREQSGLSGYAVSLHLADLVAKIGELRGNFANGIEWANSLALRAMAGSKAPLEEFGNTVQFEPVLPVDELEQLQAWQAEKDLGIVSRRELLRRRGLSEKEIEQRLQEVEDDRGAEGFGAGRIGAEPGDEGAAGAGGE